MNVDDFARADCTRFRIPPINTAKVEKYIDEILTTAWQQGKSPRDALEAVLASENVTGVLAEQINENLAFQKEVRLKKLNEERDRILKRKEAEYRLEQERLQALFGTRVEKTAEERTRLYRQLEEQRSSYNSTHAQLEEMRHRVDTHLKSIGGAQGLQTLLTINKIVTDKFASVPASHSQDENESREIESQTRNVAQTQSAEAYSSSYISESKRSDDTAPPHHKDYHDNYTSRRRPAKPHEPFMKKLWRLLNYRIW